MDKKNFFIIEVGTGGRIHLPKEVMEALDVVPGNQIKFDIAGGGVSIGRHQLKDPFADLANKKKGPDFKDLFAKEADRKKEAARVFEKRVQEKHEIRPEDREDFWR
ncbi:MAG: hypothetical protein V3V62_01385 [bacterium]